MDTNEGGTRSSFGYGSNDLSSVNNNPRGTASGGRDDDDDSKNSPPNSLSDSTFPDSDRSKVYRPIGYNYVYVSISRDSSMSNPVVDCVSEPILACNNIVPAHPNLSFSAPDLTIPSSSRSDSAATTASNSHAFSIPSLEDTPTTTSFSIRSSDSSLPTAEQIIEYFLGENLFDSDHRG